jgi:hypothetical protein
MLKQKPQPTLDDRIPTLRAEIDAFIDGLVEAERKRMGGGVPPAVIRHGITRGLGCQCAAYLQIKKDNAA